MNAVGLLVVWVGLLPEQARPQASKHGASKSLRGPLQLAHHSSTSTTGLVQSCQAPTGTQISTQPCTLLLFVPCKLMYCALQRLIYTKIFPLALLQAWTRPFMTWSMPC